MNMNVVFDIPPEIAEGLRKGILERTGGVIRDPSTKKVVTWLRDSGSEASKHLTNPPFPGGLNKAIAITAPIISAVDLGISVAGFTVVLQKLNNISNQIKKAEEKVDIANKKLDDAAIAKLKAGINACQNAIELKSSDLRLLQSAQAINALHEARQFFNQQILRTSAAAESTSVEYLALGFLALSAEAQTFIQLDETEKAQTTIDQGLNELRPGLTQLMNTIIGRSAELLRPEFSGSISLEFITFLHNGLKRMEKKPGEHIDRIKPSEVFEKFRCMLPETYRSTHGWHKDLPKVLVDTSDVPDWYIGPINQGVDEKKRLKKVKTELPLGLSKIAALVEVYDRLCAQFIQLEQIHEAGGSSAQIAQQLQLNPGTNKQIMLAQS